MPIDNTSRPKVLVENTAVEAMALAAELFKSAVCQAVSDRHVCNIALAGGTTPHALYHQLAETGASGDMPWADVEIYFGDERDVPHDNVESNYHMVQTTMLDHVPVTPDRIHPMPADVGDLDAAAAQYESIIRRNIPAEPGSPPRFDVILLGMGADGHAASLFPGMDALDETNKLVTACFVPVLGRYRMTFTFPLINAAHTVLLLVTGADKAEAVATLLGDDTAGRGRLPAARICPRGSYVMVLDAPAARLTSLKAQLK